MAPPRKPKPTDPRWRGEQFWFKAKVGEPVHEQVVPFVRQLRELYAAGHNRDRIHERLYDGAELKRMSTATQALAQRGFAAARLNVSKSVVNTVVSRLSKNRPMPSFIVDDADWTLKRKSKQYRKFILGEMMATDFDVLSKEALQDGAIVGTGLTIIDDSGDGEKVIAERVLREEILFDPRECKYGRPPNAFRCQRIARDHLMEMFPQHAGAIINASSSDTRNQDDIDDESRQLSLDDYVDVFTAWHLPRGCDAKDGRKAICIDGATLASEEWCEPRFPIAMFRYQKPRRGIWAKGLVFELKDIQDRINKIVRDMQMNLAATGRGFYAAQKGSAPPASLLTGHSPFVVEYAGSNAPVWQAPQAINPAQLQMLQFFIQQAFELPGVSQAAASSKSSLGAGASGVALDTQYDIESERFAMEESQYAEYRLDAAQLYIDASKRVARKRAEGKERKPYVSGWLHRDAIEKLEHDKVSLEYDQYKLQIEPVNFIPTTRAGKLSAVGQLSQAGIIPPWLAAALFDEPDLQRANRITLGAFFNAERKMETLAEETMDIPVPAPWNDFELERKMCVAYINYWESEKAPAIIIDRYEQYLELLDESMAKKREGDAALAPPPPAGMPGDPATGPGMVPAPGQPIPQMSGGALPPEMMPAVAA